jgi:transposase
VHKVAGVREAIEARGATLFYLPPYSQDLNPIEQFFSKPMAVLCNAAAYGRSSARASPISRRRSLVATSIQVIFPGLGATPQSRCKFFRFGAVAQTIA